MSATNRGSKRAANDLYETPEWCTTAVCRYLLRKHLSASTRFILEPCAGKGRLARVVRSEFPGSMVFENELNDPESHQSGLDFSEPDSDWAVRNAAAIALNSDYLRRFKFDLCITNPPYYNEVLTDIIENGICSARHCVMLLRVNWVTGGRSRDWFRHRYPCDLLTLSKRPSFVGGKTDATEYCWAHWYGQEQGRFIPLDNYICKN